MPISYVHIQDTETKRQRSQSATRSRRGDPDEEVASLKAEIERVKAVHRAGADINRALEAELRTLKSAASAKPASPAAASAKPASPASVGQANELSTARKDKARAEREADVAKKALEDLRTRHDRLEAEAKRLKEAKQATERLNSELATRGAADSALSVRHEFEVKAHKDTRKELETAKRALESSRSKHEAAQRQLETTEDKWETARSGLERTKTELERTKAELERSKARAEAAPRADESRARELERQLEAERKKSLAAAESAAKVDACRDLLGMVHKTLEVCSNFHKTLPDKGLHEALTDSRDHVRRFMQTL